MSQKLQKEENKHMKVLGTAGRIELPDHSKLANTCKASDICAYNMTRVEQNAANKGNLESKKITLPTIKLCIGKYRMFALRDEQDKITHNLDVIIKVAERFYTRLYASDIRRRGTTASTSSTCDIQKEEVGKVLKGIKIRKAALHDGITEDLSKGKNFIVQEKLARCTILGMLKDSKSVHSLKKASIN